jgi:hypothetical protein
LLAFTAFVAIGDFTIFTATLVAVGATADSAIGTLGAPGL